MVDPDKNSGSYSGALDLEISFHSVPGGDPASRSTRPEADAGLVLGGRYRLVSKVGVGGMGEVWSAEHLATRSKLAVKMLLPRSLGVREIVARFDREAILLGRLRTEHVPRAIDFFQDASFGPVLVTELVEGESLTARMREPLSVEQAIDLAIELATGVAELHAAHVVHRDLKPANVIMGADGDGRSRAVILDLGVARLLHDSSDVGHVSPVEDITTCGMVVGTFEYIAPEQIVQCGDVTMAADVYSLGAIVYRAVAGKHVFGDHLDRAELVRTKLTTDAPLLPTNRRDALATGLARVVARALERDRARRYPSAAALRADLVALRERSVNASAPVPSTTARARSGRGVRYRIIAAAMAATLLLGAACARLDRNAARTPSIAAATQNHAPPVSTTLPVPR
jgi:eukaryotic-like serine/threonine-protein kinase